MIPVYDGRVPTLWRVHVLPRGRHRRPACRGGHDNSAADTAYGFPNGIRKVESANRCSDDLARTPRRRNIGVHYALQVRAVAGGLTRTLQPMARGLRRTAPPTSPAERRGAAAPRRMWWQLDESAAGDGGGDVSTSSFEAAEAAAAAAVGEGVGPWQADDDGADAAAGDPLHALRARLGAAAPASASVFDTALADASDAATCSGGGAGGAESGVGWRRAARVLPNAAGEADAGVRAETIAERVLRHVRSTAPVPAHVSGVPSPPSSPPPPPPPPPPRAPARAPLSPTAAAAAPATLPLSPPGLPSVRAAPAPHSPTVVRSQSPEFDAAGRGGGRGGGGGAVYAAAPRRPAEASPASRATNVSRAEFEAYVEMLMSAPLDSWVGSPDAPASPGALLAGARASAQDWMGAAGGGAAWAADYAVPAALPPMAPVCGGFPPDATAVRRALGGGRGAGVVEDVAATIARCRARVSGAGSPGDCSPSSRSQSDDGDSGGASDAASGDSLSDGPHSDDGGSSGDGTDGEPGGGGCEEGRMGTVGWSAPPPPSGVAVTSADADTSLESSEAAGRPSVVIPVIDVSAVSDGNGSGGSATDAPLSSGDDTSGMAPEQAVAILHVINALASSPPSRGAAAAAAVAAQRDGHDWAEDDGVPPLREGPLSPPRRPSPRIGIAAQGIRLTPRTRLSSLSSLGGARRGGHQVIDTLVKTVRARAGGRGSCATWTVVVPPRADGVFSVI